MPYSPLDRTYHDLGRNIGGWFDTYYALSCVHDEEMLHLICDEVVDTAAARSTYSASEAVHVALRVTTSLTYRLTQ